MDEATHVLGQRDQDEEENRQSDPDQEELHQTELDVKNRLDQTQGQKRQGDEEQPVFDRPGHQVVERHRLEEANAGFDLIDTHLVTDNPCLRIGPIQQRDRPFSRKPSVVDDPACRQHVADKARVGPIGTE